MKSYAATKYVVLLIHTSKLKVIIPQRCTHTSIAIFYESEFPFKMSEETCLTKGRQKACIYVHRIFHASHISSSISRTAYKAKILA